MQGRNSSKRTRSQSLSNAFNSPRTGNIILSLEKYCSLGIFIARRRVRVEPGKHVVLVQPQRKGFAGGKYKLGNAPRR